MKRLIFVTMYLFVCVTILLTSVFAFASVSQIIPSKGKNEVLRLPNSVAVDSKGFIIVADTDNCRIMKFDPTGKKVFSIGMKGNQKNQFSYPAAVTCDKNGNIYVADTGNSRLVKLSPDGKWLASWEKVKVKRGKLQTPMGIAVDRKGYIYVSDYSLSKIVKYNSKGQFVSEITKLNIKGDKLNFPRGIAVDPAGNLYVADSGNNRVVVINQKGNVVNIYNKIGNYFKLHHPLGIAIDQSGVNIAITDTDYHRVILYSTKMRKAYTWGKNEKNKFNLNYPTGVCFDLKGNIIVADTYNSRIVKIVFNK
ncbi:NHL repeat-containing protein [Anaerocellum danielii]|uniref:NHL repeat-containing protein n=1 Tax=Anaerocellum danielii TaxID=1387557 RepID=A0ABZ0TY53_9FIRM|nr:NHL repeat-containing protein [Caldicellulosiruptor danielii]WPX08011.1 NHL repeat-containing protein [Caldicellulosiruptor danielii]